MNSKEAVKAVLDHKQPQYIPLGTYAIDWDTVEKILGHETYVRNKVKTQIALWEGRRDEVAQSLKEDSVELFRKLDCIDIILPHKEAVILPPAGYTPPKVKRTGTDIWEDEDGTIYKCSEFSNTVAVIEQPDHYTLEQFQEKIEYNIPDPSMFEAYDHLIKSFKNERFIMGTSGGFNILLLLGGMENGLVKYYLEPYMVKAALGYYCKIQNFLDEYYIKNEMDGVIVEDDVATTTGPMISPGMFREFLLPVMKERIANIKKYKQNIVLHCCGDTLKLMDMFIETGINGYQSLQTGTNMKLGELKKKFGGSLAFWGGVSVENLVGGTPDDIREDVRRAMQEGKSDNGFILGPSHSIAYGTKYDNLMAMLDEYDKLKYCF